MNVGRQMKYVSQHVHCICPILFPKETSEMDVQFENAYWKQKLKKKFESQKNAY